MRGLHYLVYRETLMVALGAETIVMCTYGLCYVLRDKCGPITYQSGHHGYVCDKY
jgi:hypothetical protein